MRFFVFQLFLVSLLSVIGCQQENPEITKLWDEDEKWRLEIIELRREYPDWENIPGVRADVDWLVNRRSEIVQAILEIDPDATFPNSDNKIADTQR